MDTQFHVGFDDTDSHIKGCTTYIAAILSEILEKEVNCVFTDYPNLIRLNPNIPWKTRGNGALSLHIQCDNRDLDEVKNLIIEAVKRASDIESERTDPAIAFFSGSIPQALTYFSFRAICDVIPLKEAYKLAQTLQVETVLLKGERGLVGCLAALGDVLRSDHTFELITYRVSENCGQPRRIDVDSIKRMDEETTPHTFNNFDYEVTRPLITPHGPDPIFFGIRGETPQILLKAKNLIKPLEQIERWCIFRTNHGTDMHLCTVYDLSQVRPYIPIVATGHVSRKPTTIQGSHVIFSIADDRGEVDCAAYEPTGDFREVIKKLIPGDLVQVFGGARPPTQDRLMTVNLEKIWILRLQPNVQFLNPLCPSCGRRMESAGKNQGFRCRRCKTSSIKREKIPVRISRDLKEGLYIPPPRAHRHLTKPFLRYGLEKRGFNHILLPQWHKP